jgi:hypothetical protein
MHAGPTAYTTGSTAQAPKRAPKGRKGAAERANRGKKLARRHEAKGKSAPKGRGYGKIKSTGKPRFTRFSQF